MHKSMRLKNDYQNFPNGQVTIGYASVLSGCNFKHFTINVLRRCHNRMYFDRALRMKFSIFFLLDSDHRTYPFHPLARS